MLDEHGLDTRTRGLMLAALVIEVARERYGYSDSEMNLMVGIATQVYLHRLLPEGDRRGVEARRITLEATDRFANLVRQIDEADQGRPTH